MPLTLVIESATPALSVALIDRGNVVGRFHEVVGRGHAERLMPAIATLLNHRRPDTILVDCGPGSFTGIRVGIAAALGLRLGWSVPAAGFSSLALIAAGRGPRTGPFAVAIEGGHGEIFVQRFRDAGTPDGSFASMTPAAAAVAITDHDVFGSGAAALVQQRGSGAAHPAMPDAAHAAALPADACRLAPVPLYGRAPDARPRA